jgi:hypothetical protein
MIAPMRPIKRLLTAINYHGEWRSRARQTAVKVPNSKPQVPRERQIANSKSSATTLEFGIWNLELLWILKVAPGCFPAVEFQVFVMLMNRFFPPLVDAENIRLCLSQLLHEGR